MCTLVSPLLKGTEFTISVNQNVEFFERVRVLRFSSVKWAWQGIEAPKQTIDFPAAPSFLLIEKMNQIINIKNYRKKKKRWCVRLRSEDKHQLRKSADRKAQISPVNGTNAYLICAFRSADILRWCLSSERNLTHNLFFYTKVVLKIGRLRKFNRAGEIEFKLFYRMDYLYETWQHLFIMFMATKTLASDFSIFA